MSSPSDNGERSSPPPVEVESTSNPLDDVMDEPAETPEVPTSDGTTTEHQPPGESMAQTESPLDAVATIADSEPPSEAIAVTENPDEDGVFVAVDAAVDDTTTAITATATIDVSEPPSAAVDETAPADKPDTAIPVSDPPVSNPPVSDPPVSDPPVSDPPVSDPPKEEVPDPAPAIEAPVVETPVGSLFATQDLNQRIAHPEPATKPVAKPLIIHLPKSGNAPKFSPLHKKRRPKRGVVCKYLVPCLGFISLLWLAFTSVMMSAGPNVDKVIKRFVGQVTGLYHIAAPDSFSACIFVKDENHRLVEWIAYHYHAFDLEYLIVGYDKASETSPLRVLNRWTKKITTELWEEDVYAPPEKMIARNGVKSLRPRKQQLFYKQCIRRLKAEGRTYTLFVDADEFVTFRYPSKFTTPDAATLQKDYRNVLIPSVRTKGAVNTFLRQEAAKGGSLANPCITIPRLRFIGKETSYTDPMNMDTLRFSAHGKRDFVKHNGLAKNIIDVSRVDLNSLELIRNPNAMIKGVCWNPQLKMANSLFQVNHYLGSWESFSARQGPDSEYVGGIAEYNKFSTMEDGTDDIIRPWLEGFVNTDVDAIEMFKDAGKLDLPLVVA